MSDSSSLPRLALVTIVAGLGAGLGGMALALLLHVTQHLAYGYSVHQLTSPESFFVGVSAASPLRRVAILAGCGVLAGGGWYLLERFARPLVSIEDAIAADLPRMPMLATTAHAVLQIATVALGSPLGREVAPRELGATFATWLCARTGLTADESRRLIACAAGAGLAAVYNAPLGGTVFVLEVLLRTLEVRVVVPALATSAIATVVAWAGLGNKPLYSVQHLAASASPIVWAIVVGPLIGIVAYWVRTLIDRARGRAARHWRLLVLCPINFTIIGVLAIPFPELLGNGRAPAQLGFAGELSIGLAAILLVLKVSITVSSFRAGAAGGMLTPSLSNGALLATVLGGLWSMAWPGTPPGAYALIAAAAFVASSMHMPVTAILLLVEFTWIEQSYLIPVLLAVTGSAAASRLCERRARRRHGPTGGLTG